MKSGPPADKETAAQPPLRNINEDAAAMDTFDDNLPAFEQPPEQIDLSEQADVQETMDQGSAPGMLRASHSDPSVASPRMTDAAIPGWDAPSASASTSRSATSASGSHSHRKSRHSRESRQSSTAEASSTAEDTHTDDRSTNLSSDESCKLVEVRHPNKRR